MISIITYFSKVSGILADVICLPYFFRVITFISLLLSPYILSAANVQLTADGLLISDSYRHDNPQPYLSATYSFRITINDCQWLIALSKVNTTVSSFVRPPEAARAKDLRPADGVSTTAGTDGTNIYSLTSWTVPAEDGADTSEHRNYASVIEKGVVPHLDTTPQISVLWYAFASHCYLRQTNHEFLEIPFIPTSRNEFDFDYLYKARSAINSDFPSLPSEIYFIAPGATKHWKTEIDAISEPPTMHPLPEPFNNGYTIASYRAKQFKKIGELTIPEDSEYKVYAPRLVTGTAPMLDGENLFIVRHYQIHLVSANSKVEETNFVPRAPSSRFSVIDLRLVKARPPAFNLSYDATNTWPTVENILARPDLRAQFAFGRSMSESHRHRSWFVKSWIIFGILVLTGIPFLIMSKSLKQTKQQSKENS